MRIVRASSEDEMILEFLQQEFASKVRYGESLSSAFEETGLDSTIITQGSIANSAQNADRRRLFAAYRGYGRPGNSYFTDFPVGQVSWSWVEIDREELLTTLFVRYWAERWGSSRLPRDLAEDVRNRRVPKEAIDEDWATPHVERAKQIEGGLKLPPSILVSADGGKTRVVMEGNSRLTSYALAEDSLSDSFLVLYGESPLIANWDEW